jgi:hypothetical protein
MEKRTDSVFNEIVISKILPEISRAFCELYNDCSGSKLIDALGRDIFNELCNQKANDLKTVINNYIDKQVTMFDWEI